MVEVIVVEVIVVEVFVVEVVIVKVTLFFYYYFSVIGSRSNRKKNLQPKFEF